MRVEKMHSAPPLKKVHVVTFNKPYCRLLHIKDCTTQRQIEPKSLERALLPRPAAYEAAAPLG